MFFFEFLISSINYFNKYIINVITIHSDKLEPGTVKISPAKHAEISCDHANFYNLTLCIQKYKNEGVKLLCSALEFYNHFLCCFPCYSISANLFHHLFKICCSEYGYWRELGSEGKCVVNPHAPPLDVCDLVGQEVAPHLLEMINYRRIPGDRCQGGWEPLHSNLTFEERTSHCPPKQKSVSWLNSLSVSTA